MSFGNKLKQLRRQNDLTQLQMSEKQHMEQSNYSRYERDKTIPTADVIMRVANIFKVEPDWLMQPDGAQINFETGSINNGNGAVINLEQQHNSYSIPQEMLDMLMNQQKLLAALMQKLMEKL